MFPVLYEAWLWLLAIFGYRTAVPDRDSNSDADSHSGSDSLVESVNYHFTRQCNYSCGFCFHTAKTSFVLPLEDAKRGIQLLADAGMQKINFSGGEPFLVERGNFVGKLVKFSKEIGLPSVSIVSNGSLVKRSWFEKYAQWLDILAVSCDSFHEATNRKIGRHQARKVHLEGLHKVQQLCKEFGVIFKLNTVVNAYNVTEDMRENVRLLRPQRWKVFQALKIEGENAGGQDNLRDVNEFLVSDEAFRAFIDLHSDCEPGLEPVPEDNDIMRNSYLILDEYMRFLDCTAGDKKPSHSLLDVGVTDAVNASGHDKVAFLRRGGKYEWTKKKNQSKLDF